MFRSTASLLAMAALLAACGTTTRDRPVALAELRPTAGNAAEGSAWFVQDRYPGVGCVLALEFKKTWMDEWTGEVDDARLDCVRASLAATLPGLHEELERLR